MCHRWWRRGERAPGTRQIGYQWAYIFSAVRPDTGDDVTLVMPSINAKVMDLFLAHFADTLDQDAHAVMMCDGAGESRISTYRKTTAATSSATKNFWTRLKNPWTG